MKKILYLSFIFIFIPAYLLLAQDNSMKETTLNGTTISVHPVHHATMVLNSDGKNIYVDPTGGAKAFADYEDPDLILITDIHGDHFSVETIQALDTQNTRFVVPKAVAQKMPEKIKDQLIVLDNGENTTAKGIAIRAIPMYNLPKSPEAYHVKGRGNGYILTLSDKKVYIAGDTEGIPEMRSLENIYMAFIPMNLPYTMTVEQAADAVLDFEPKIVYPYHYSDSNIQKFKRLVNEGNPNIEVRLRDWYPKKNG